MFNTIIFAVAFAAGLLYYRVFFLINPGYFKKPFTRTKTGLQIHHLHFGMVYVLIGTLVLLAIGEHFIVYIILGYGLGQIFDDFISDIMMKGDRPEELRLYKETLPHTLILGAAIVAVAFITTYLVSL